MVVAIKKRQGLALASAADPRSQTMACDPSITLNLHFVSFLSFPSLSFYFLSWSRSCSCCCLFFVDFLSFLILPLSLHSSPVFLLCFVFPSFFFLALLLSCLFLSPCVSFVFVVRKCWQNSDLIRNCVQPVHLPPFSQPPYQPKAGLIGKNYVLP